MPRPLTLETATTIDIAIQTETPRICGHVPSLLSLPSSQSLGQGGFYPAPREQSGTSAFRSMTTHSSLTHSLTTHSLASLRGESSSIAATFLEFTIELVGAAGIVSNDSQTIYIYIGVICSDE